MKRIAADPFVIASSSGMAVRFAGEPLNGCAIGITYLALLNGSPTRDKGYARTNQAVGLQHRVAKDTLRVRFVGSYRELPTCRNAKVRAWMVAKIRNALSGQCPDEYNKGIQYQSGGAP